MAYILKVGADQFPTIREFVVPTRGSERSIQNGEVVFVWSDYSAPNTPDGGLTARGIILDHRYENGQITLRIQVDTAPLMRSIATSSLDAHKGSDDQVWGAIAEVRRNTNHRIFQVRTEDAVTYLEDCFVQGRP
jgi:hypothetical protein